jgi:hypothetical protein
MAQETRVVSGTIADSSGNPVSYVSLDGGRFRTLSNASGEFRLTIPAKDRIEVTVRRIGYLPTKFRVEPGADTSITVVLQPLAVLLSTQVVQAQQLVRALEVRGFYERMHESQRGALVGQYVTPEEIEMRRPNRVSQLLDQKHGIRVTRVGACNIVVQCYRVMGQGGCAATIYLDGHRLNPLRQEAAGLASAPPIDEIIPISGVAGIEVYPRGATAPPKYQMLGGSCAIVLVWTR